MQSSITRKLPFSPSAGAMKFAFIALPEALAALKGCERIIHARKRRKRDVFILEQINASPFCAVISQ